MPAVDNGLMSMDKPMTVVLVSGGSGGHLMPAVALAEQLKPDAQCLFVSTCRPIDRSIAESSLDPWMTVELGPFTPLRRWFWPRYWVRQIRAVGQIRTFLRRSRPDVVVGFGGYLSAVGVLLARSGGIRTILHEQNVLPGRANRWLAGWADAVAISFPDTQRCLRTKAHVEVTGNPIRFNGRTIERSTACAACHLDPARPVVLVMGGSQGSQSVNGLALAMWDEAPVSRRRQIQVIHLAGQRETARVESAYRRMGIEARVFPFLREMQTAFGAATMAISRAGATGIAEMAALQVPALLIPYPHAGAHQRANADWMQRIGGAVVLEERGLTPQRLWQEVIALVDDAARLGRMREALRARADGSAGERLGSLVKRIAMMQSVRAERA